MVKKTALIIYTLILLILVNSGIVTTVAASPFFPEQSIHGDSFAYFPEHYLEDNTDALSLEGASYFSDGKTLDATLILHGNDGFEASNTLSYGMLIDRDSDFNTGINGFDYRYRVQWNNGTWYEIYDKLPTFSPLPQIMGSPHNIANPFASEVLMNDGQVKSTINLQLNLARIGNPAYYTVVFFTEGHMEGTPSLIQDVLSLAVIPPLNFVINTYPSPLSFESSTEKVVHILIDSTFTENAKIYYDIQSDGNDTSITPPSDNSIVLQNGKAEIPTILTDKGHDDIQVHRLYVNLSPWYELNPKTDVERGGEIYLSYNYRNTPEFEPYVILWTSLPQPPFMDSQTSVQVTMLIFTIIMAIIGIITYRNNSGYSNYLKKNDHTREIIGAYDRMLSLVCKVDRITKQLTLKFPKEEKIRLLVKAGSEVEHKDELMEFNSQNVHLYESALKHLKYYDSLNKNWQDLQNRIEEYNEKVKSLKNDIRKTCLETIHEKLPNFKQDDETSGNAFHIDAIEREAYEVLEDVMHDREPMFVPFVDYIKFRDMYDDNIDDDRGEYNAYMSSTLFSSSKPLPNEINEILPCVLKNSLKIQYKSLIEFEQQTKNQLNKFRSELSVLVKDLNEGILIEGKCKLKY